MPRASGENLSSLPTGRYAGWLERTRWRVLDALEIDGFCLLHWPGHVTNECTATRVNLLDKVPTETPETAWKHLEVADAEKDVSGVREVSHTTVILADMRKMIGR